MFITNLFVLAVFGLFFFLILLASCVSAPSPTPSILRISDIDDDLKGCDYYQKWQQQTSETIPKYE